MYTSLREVISFRALVATIGIIGIVYLPWWIPALCMVALALRYAAIEVVAIGLLMDFYWYVGGVGMLPLFTLGSVLLLWLLMPLRERLLTA